MTSAGRPALVARIVGRWTLSETVRPAAPWWVDQRRMRIREFTMATQVIQRQTARSLAAAHTVDACKVYGQEQTEVRALDGVTVDFAGGRFTAIMGPSGSGKSTLLHCMAGLDTLTSGQAFIGDADLSRLNDQDLTVLRRDRIGFVFQAYNLVPTLTRAGEHHACRCGSPARRPIPAWIDQVVDTVGLRRPARAPADRAVRRPAAAGRRGPGPGQPAGDHLRRRADRQPRLAGRRRGAGVHAAAPSTSSARRS